MQLQSTKAKVINTDAVECMEEMAAALKWLLDQKWVSVEKDNMEFQCRTTCFVLEKARAALARYEASK